MKIVWNHFETLSRTRCPPVEFCSSWSPFDLTTFFPYTHESLYSPGEECVFQTGGWRVCSKRCNWCTETFLYLSLKTLWRTTCAASCRQIIYRRHLGSFIKRNLDTRGSLLAAEQMGRYIMYKSFTHGQIWQTHEDLKPCMLFVQIHHPIKNAAEFTKMILH